MFKETPSSHLQPDAEHPLDAVLPEGAIPIFDKEEKDHIQQLMDGGMGRNAAIKATGVEVVDAEDAAKPLIEPTPGPDEITARRLQEIEDGKTDNGGFHRSTL